MLEEIYRMTELEMLGWILLIIISLALFLLLFIWPLTAYIKSIYWYKTKKSFGKFRTDYAALRRVQQRKKNVLFGSSVLIMIVSVFTGFVYFVRILISVGTGNIIPLGICAIVFIVGTFIYSKS